MELNVLDNFQQDDTSPSCFGRGFTLQAHLHHKLREFNKLEGSSNPIVSIILFRPRSRETGVQRGRNKRSIIAAVLNDGGQKRVMIHTYHIKQR